jgi:uncharacterized membrane protein
MTARRIARYFVRGCLVLVPLAMTLYIIYFILSAIDRLLPIGIPGVGLVLTVLMITVVGFLTSNVIGRSVFDLTDGILARLPLVKLLYNSIKDLVRAFVGDHKSFNRPAAVTLVSGSDTKMLGFVTRDGLAPLGFPGHVAVYFPQSYNFAGNLLIVPREQVELLDISTAELMTFIVSGGISGFGMGQSLLPPPSVANNPKL